MERSTLDVVVRLSTGKGEKERLLRRIKRERKPVKVVHMEDLDSGVFVYGKTKDKLRYIFSKAKEKWSDVYWWRKTVFPFVARSIVCFYYQKIVGNKGIYVMEEDWDNLIVLDACRYDLFKEVANTGTDYRISRGSFTPEFLIENFDGRKYYDTVIVTANPYVDKLVKESFYKVISVWKDGWDGKYNTVLPQTMLKYGLKAEKMYPDKRLIVWFLQPHEPFIEDPEIYTIDFRRSVEGGGTSNIGS